jgi:uncharacterized protein (TIGR00661 family)
MTVFPHRPALFFGVNSEGMGHATRALPLLQGLSAHYEVHVFCGGRAHRYLAERLPRVHAVWHLQLSYADNRFLLGETVRRSVGTLPVAARDAFRIARMMARLSPVAVVTDYEPLTAYAALLTGRKVVSIDNQAVVTHGAYPEPVDAEGRRARAVMRRSNFFSHPVCHRTLVSSFFQPPLLPGAAERGVRYVPTTLRAEVEARRGRVRTDGPVLVYQTSSSNADLPGTLAEAHRATGLRFALYGAGGGAAPREGVRVRPFSEEGFLDDLAAAPFVIVNGGHSTINEALALGKPVLAEPIAAQDEQATNVQGLEQLGVGRGTRKLSAGDVVAFHRALPALARRAAALRVADTGGVVRAVMEALCEVAPQRAVRPGALEELRRAA